MNVRKRRRLYFVLSLLAGGAAAAGWTGYPPLSAKNEYTGGGYGMDLWLLALALEFASFLLGGINFLTTAINMRAPGMTFNRMPLFVWSILVTVFLLLLSLPVLAGEMAFAVMLCGASSFARVRVKINSPDLAM